MVDIRLLKKIESIGDGLKAIQRTKPHPNAGWMVVVGNLSAPLALFTELICRFTHIPYRRFDTLPEALAFLHQIDASLISV